MSKFLRKIAVALMLIVLSGLVTGCSAGSTVDTVLNINEDLSGTRVMTLVVDQSVFESNFTGTVEELNAVIAQSCPEFITWSYDDSTGAMVYSFTISFTSPVDYKTKIDSIIGEGWDSQLVIYKGESIWASGLYVYEDFTTSDLLSWLKTACVDAGFVSSSDSSKIFSLGEHTIIYGLEEYNVSSNMSVDDITYIDINKIEMFTDASQLDVYNKTIVMSLPEESMTLKGEEIKTFFADHVPTGATATWTTDGTDSIYTVIKEGMTAEDLQTFLNEFFDTELCVVEQTDILEGMSPFSFNIGLVETVDFSNYLVGDVINNTDIYYLVKGLNGYVGGRELQSLEYYGENDDIYDNEYRSGDLEYASNSLTCECASYFQKIYRVKDISVETSKGMFGDMGRKLVFTLDGEPTEAEQESILSKINALSPVEEDSASSEETETTNVTESTEGTESTEVEAPKLEWKVDVDGKAKDGNYVVTIKQSGSREEIQLSSQMIFGYAGDLYCAENFHFMNLNYGLSVYDRFELGAFVDYVTDDMTSSYVLDTGFGSTIEYTNLSENAEVNNSKLTISQDVQYGVEVTTYGTQFNIWALLFYIFVIIAIVCTIIILNKLGVFKKIAEYIQKKRVASASDATTAAPTATPVVENEETPMFCENCGAKRDADALVCTECGTKF